MCGPQAPQVLLTELQKGGLTDDNPFKAPFENSLFAGIANQHQIHLNSQREPVPRSQESISRATAGLNIRSSGGGSRGTKKQSSSKRGFNTARAKGKRNLRRN